MGGDVTRPTSGLQPYPALVLIGSCRLAMFHAASMTAALCCFQIYHAISLITTEVALA
jgi:hypothetical protein